MGDPPKFLAERVPRGDRPRFIPIGLRSAAQSRATTHRHCR